MLSDLLPRDAHFCLSAPRTVRSLVFSIGPARTGPRCFLDSRRKRVGTTEFTVVSGGELVVAIRS